MAHCLIASTDLAANLIGRGNARKAARILFAAVQNRRLTKHLIYTLLEDVLDAVFGKGKG